MEELSKRIGLLQNLVDGYQPACFGVKAERKRTSDFLASQYEVLFSKLQQLIDHAMCIRFLARGVFDDEEAEQLALVEDALSVQELYNALDQKLVGVITLLEDKDQEFLGENNNELLSNEDGRGIFASGKTGQGSDICQCESSAGGGGTFRGFIMANLGMNIEQGTYSHLFSIYLDSMDSETMKTTHDACNFDVGNLDGAGVIIFEEAALHEEPGAEEEDIAERGNETEKAANEGTLAEEDIEIVGGGRNGDDGAVANLVAAKFLSHAASEGVDVEANIIVEHHSPSNLSNSGAANEFEGDTPSNSLGLIKVKRKTQVSHWEGSEEGEAKLGGSSSKHPLYKLDSVLGQYSSDYDSINAGCFKEKTIHEPSSGDRCNRFFDSHLAETTAVQDGLTIYCIALFLAVLATGSINTILEKKRWKKKKHHQRLLSRALKIRVRTPVILCTLVMLTASFAAEPINSIEKKETPFNSWIWDTMHSLLPTWASISSNDDAASQIDPMIQDEDSYYLRGEKDLVNSRRLSLADCALDQFYDDETTKCVTMKEFGSSCKVNDTCFSGNCMESQCQCPEDSDCWGCSSADAPCFRIEQTHPFQLLQVCRLSATIRGKPNQKFKLFSAGGKAVSNAPEGYNSLSKLVLSESQTAEIACSEFWPFLDLEDAPQVLPPAFAQSNILTQSGDDVYELVASGPFTGLLDSLIFLDNNWISTIHEEYRPSIQEDNAIVPVWPRSNRSAFGETLVIEVSDEQFFNTDIAAGHGLEFLGVAENATVRVRGNIQMEGRLSFKNVIVSFEDGSINATGPMIFQSCDLVDLFRCPPFFQEVNGLCLYATEMPDQADDAFETCGFFDRGFVSAYNDINASEVARKLLLRGESMWVAPEDGKQCSSIHRDGSLVSYPNLFSDNSTCEEYTRVLCASTIKEAIVGRQYTSYFSNQYIMNHRELFDRIVDPKRLPIQVGANLTVFQEDSIGENDDGEAVATEYTVSDEVPTALSVVVELAYGTQEDIQVAFDSFREPSFSSPHEWNFNSNSSLPSKIQIHTNGSVCVSSVSLLFRNETGTDHLAIQIPAKLFEGCLDFNVCDENNTRICGRSLMYYDSRQECAVLRTDNAIYPRDLSLSIFDGLCSRLTTWNHPSLGEPFMIELERDLNSTTDIELAEVSSDRNKYIFDTSRSVISQVLDEDKRLPTEFSLKGGDGGLVISVSVTRYNKVISGVHFPSLWDCINVCSAVATGSGLLLGENVTELAYLDLINTISCRKLTSIYTEGRRKDGREACTSPPRNVSTLSELNDELSYLDSSDQPYRTLSTKITSSIKDIGTIVIPTNRGLSLFVDLDATGGISISAANFTVSWLAECFLDGATLDGTTHILVEEEGLVEVSGCIITQDHASPPFLINAGEAVLTSVGIKEDTKLQNIYQGRLDLTYVEFLNRSSLENLDDGIMELSRLTLYEDFIEPSQENLGGGKVLLEEASRLYDALDDEDDSLCLGNESPDLTLQLSSTACKERCEDAFVCTGAFVYFDEENKAQCDLCLRDTDCAFNCSAVNSVYYKPKSNFDFTRVSACPALTRPFEPLEGASLEECKLYCSWYKTCEGFRLDVEGAENKTTCNLLADLDLNDTCSTSDNEIIYIPYLQEIEEFLSVEGVLVNPSNPLAVYRDKTVSECSALCKKTLYCVSFTSDGGDCTLYDSNIFRRSEVTGLHIRIDDIFPKKRYFDYQACVIDVAYSNYNTKTQKRCQARCDDDLNCAAFSFQEFESHNVTNCKLHDRIAIIDEVFEEKAGCNTTEVSIAYAVETFVKNSLQEFMFTEVASTHDLLEDECKALCLFDVECIALQYVSFDNSTNSSVCTVGYLSASDEVLDDFDVQDVLVLEARSSDLGSEYLPVPACYKGEALVASLPTAIHRANGYVRWEKVCTSAIPFDNGQVNGIMTPADCGLRCDEEEGCGGFIHYVNYTGPYNVTKIGQCELIGGEIDVGVCNAVEQNTDVYLRADFGSICETLCNVHQLCSSFVPRIWDTNTREIECELYSDIALLDICPDDQNETSVHIGLSYRERDALVEAKGQCFIEFEDIAEIGCYGPVFPIDSFSNQTVNVVTPHHCQQHCRARGEPYYAVSDGTDCYCSSSNSFYSDLDLTSSNCTTECDGDRSQECGGSGFALIGSTDLPKTDLTLSQCKRECFKDQKCEAILYGEDDNECELRSSALFKTCDDDSSNRAFIESLEHYYEGPTYSYIGDQVLHIISIDLKPDCQKLCDAFLRCEAIHYDELTDINNCKLLGGNVVRLESNETAEGVLVARDVTLFTKGFGPDSDMLTQIGNIFDLDECKALCEAHSECGAMVFGNKDCTLYPRSGFADVEYDVPWASPHYVDFKTFVDIDQDFHPATRMNPTGGIQGFCIDDSGDTPPTPLSSRLTTQSSHDCAARCNENLSCRLFTYNEENSSDCTLYGDGVNLRDACSGITTLTFVMFTRGRFSLREGCLKNESSPLLLTHKSIVECAALCDSWFACRSFRIDQDTGECRLYSPEQYDEGFCLDSKPSGDLFSYFSEFYFVRLTENFCVASNSIIGEILEEVPLEACKTLCEINPLCVALEHNRGGSCALYSSSDFSIPCTEENGRILYISYSDVVELGRNKFEYKPMQGCFDLTNSEGWENVTSEEDCQDFCKDQCLGYQYLYGEDDDTPPIDDNGDGSEVDQCHIVQGELPPLSQPGCRANEMFSFRVERYPYQKMENTCLRNDIYDITVDSERIFDVEEYECLALCDAHPFCRYYLYGTDPSIVKPEVRECRLFKAQAQELDDCDCEDAHEYGDYCGLTAFVNGRTFVDQVTWFGEPESTYATLSGLSYQECAALCDALDNIYCSAFLHTWNYRRSSSAVQPQIFTKTRIIRADFKSGDDVALFLQFDGNGTGSDSLVVTTAEANNDDALKVQRLSNEQVVDNGQDQSFLLKFWSKTGKCITANKFSELPDGFTRNVIYANFEHVSTCQTIVIGPCDGNGAIGFTKFAYLSDVNPGRFALTYPNPSSGADENSVGCLGVQPPGGAFWQELKDDFGDMDIPSEKNCTPSVASYTDCTKTAIVRTHNNGTELETAESWKPQKCNDAFVNSEECKLGNSRTIPWYFNTIENVTLCQYPPEESCLSSTTSLDSNITTIETKCTYTTKTNETTCWYTQRNALDLLNEMGEHFDTAPECQASSEGPSEITTFSRPVFSRTYGPDCGYDDKVAIMPIQLFSYASDPVILSSDATSLCLAADKSLVPCTDTAAREWVHIFDESSTFGGEIFFTDSNFGMKCLVRTDANSVGIQSCDAFSTSSQSQRWEYDGNNGYIKVPGDKKCLIADSDAGSVTLGNCTDARARWSQYSECKLNTRQKTKPMKVELESIETPGKCISNDAKELVPCSDASASEWVYYYDPSFARLEKVGSTQCLAREVQSPYTVETYEDDVDKLPTGLMPCGGQGSPNLKNSQYYLTILGGIDANILQWTYYENEKKSGAYVPTGPKYCIEISQHAQRPCDDDLDNKEQQWRRYDTVIDATEISVKPGLLLNKVTDPEVQFQLFLFTAEGKLSRKLRAKAAGLDRDVSKIAPILTSTVNLVSESLALVSSVGGLVSNLSDGTNKAESAFKKLGTVLKFFQPFPYVGPVIKNTKLPTIMNQIAKRLRDGTKALDTTDKTLALVIEPFESFVSVVRKLSASLTASILFINNFVEFVTRTTFCSYQKDPKLLIHFERMQGWIRSLLTNIGEAVGFIGDLKAHLSVLDVFKSLMKSGVFQVFKEFRSIINGVVKFADALQFISDLADFEICYAIPQGCSKSVLGISIPWICWGKKKCTDLEAIGNFMSKIERIIRSIPLVGELWGLVESFVNKVLETLFKFFGQFLPEFKIGLGFVDDIKQKASQAKDDMYAIIDRFVGMVKIPGLTDWFNDAVAAIQEKIPDPVLDLNFDCDDVDCITDRLGNFGIGIDIDANVPSLKLKGVDYSIPDHYVDVIDQIVSNIAGFREDFQALLVAGVECNEYKTIRVNLAEYIRAGFGLEEGEIAGVPDCPFNFRICTDINFPGLDAFNESMNRRIDDLDLNGIFSRRRLQACEECGSSGVAFSIGTVKELGQTLGGGIWKVLLKMDRADKVDKWIDTKKNSVSSIKDGWIYRKSLGLRNDFCTTKYGKSICTGDLKKTFEIDNAELLLANLFDYSVKLVIGEDSGEFQFKIKVGGFFNTGFTAPRTSWRPWSRQAKHTVNKDLTASEFNKQAKIVEAVGETLCLLDYIDATRRVRTSTNGKPSPIGELLSPSRNKEIDSAMSIAYSILKGREYYGDNRVEQAKKLAGGNGRTQITDNGSEFVEELKKLQYYDARVRAEMDFERFQRARKRNPSYKGDNLDEIYFNFASRGAIRECVAPSSDSLLDELVGLPNSGIWSGFKKILTGRPKGLGPGFRSGLHSFFDSKVWEILSDIEFHTEAYGNLFGAGLDVSIVREAILGNYETDVTEFKTTLVGPFWVSNGDWAPPGPGAWADLAPWSAFEFLAKTAAQSFTTTGPETSNDLITAMRDAPEDAEHLAMAVRFGLKFEWAFFEFSIDVVGTLSESDAGKSCDANGICIGTGFNTDNFKSNKPKDCQNGREDIGFCKKPETIPCVDMTKEDCLLFDKQTPCPKKALTDCPATCGLYGSDITDDDDWPSCNVIAACSDTDTMIYLETQNGFSETGITCQNLTVSGCHTDAIKNIGDETSKPAYEWCNNYCGYLDGDLRPDKGNDNSKLQCTVRPPILPSASPTKSSSPSDGPTATTIPSGQPSDVPSSFPSTPPSGIPSSGPSMSLFPTLLPSDQPSESMVPSFIPTGVCTPPGVTGCKQLGCCSGAQCCGAQNAVCCDVGTVCCGNGNNAFCCNA